MINRRELVRLAAGVSWLSLLPFAARSQDAATPPNAESGQFPDLPADISPVQVNDEFDLLYFRVLPGFGGFTLLGEMQSRVDYWTTAPPLILDFGQSIQLQPQIIRTDIPPYGRSQFMEQGGFLEPGQIRVVQSADPTTATTSVCEQGLFPVDLTYSELVVVSSESEVNLVEQTISATASVRNDGDIPAPDVEAFALIYDDRGYYCGEVSSTEDARIIAGETVDFEIITGEGRDSGPNPFDFINRDPQVVIVAGYAPNVSISCV